jgi:O-antigen ligase
LYAGFGLYHSTIPSRDVLAMGLTLVMTLASLVLSFLIIVRKDSASVEEFLNVLVISLTFVGIVYLAESMLGLGLRSDEGVETAHFGIQRLHGPLFGAAYGQFILVPCLGFHMGKLRTGPRKRLSVPRLILVLINLVSLLALGSRGALVCLALFFLLYAFTSKGMGKKIARLLGMAVLFGTASLFVFSFADSSRLTNMEDHARSTTYEISMKIIESNGVNALLGPGYGSIWAWYLPDVEEGGAKATKRFYIWTEFGSLLYNPHSIFLMLVTELGVIGFVFFLKLTLTQIVFVRRAFHDEVYRSFLCSMC